MRQLHVIEAHDTGVLCLEYSDYDTGMWLAVIFLIKQVIDGKSWLCDLVSSQNNEGILPVATRNVTQLTVLRQKCTFS